MSEQMLRSMPLGVDDWFGIRTDNKFYVDKTEKLSSLVIDYNKVFFARPRRMGKSTLVSMLADLFANGDKNFAGTAIYGHWPDTRTYPVIKLSFIRIKSHNESCKNDDFNTQSYIDSFINAFRFALAKAFARAGFPQAYELNRNSQYLDDFLDNLADIAFEHRLVFLIDEWDHPLSSNLDHEERFYAILSVLRTFYDWLREIESPRFILVTGIMRYHQASLFTGQDIQDISMDPIWTDLAGVTEQELSAYYGPYIELAAERLQCSRDELVAKLKQYYDGHCFDEEAQVKLYCPFSLNKFFMPLASKAAAAANAVPKFDRYWMKSSESTSAVRHLLENRKIDLPQLLSLKEQDVILTASELSEPQYFSQVQVLPLLTETGYLAIKEMIPADLAPKKELSFRCGIPNFEVGEDLNKAIELHAKAKIKVSKLTENNSALKKDLHDALVQGDIPRFCTRLNHAHAKFACYKQIELEVAQRRQR